MILEVEAEEGKGVVAMWMAAGLAGVEVEAEVAVANWIAEAEAEGCCSTSCSTGCRARMVLFPYVVDVDCFCRAEDKLSKYWTDS